MRQSYKQQQQKAKSKRKSAMDLKNLCILTKKFSWGPEGQESTAGDMYLSTRMHP